MGSESENRALVEMGLPSTRYCVGLAPTSRGLCKECRHPIEEGSLRFGIEHRFGEHYEARWRHWDCAKDSDFEKAVAAANSDWSLVPGYAELPISEQRTITSGHQRTVRLQNKSKRVADFSITSFGR